MPLAGMAELHGADLDALMKRSLELGGAPVSYGDLRMKFHPFLEIPVTYIVWKADEKFPASVSVLFDKSITRWFTLDMFFMTVLLLIARLIEGAEAMG